MKLFRPFLEISVLWFASAVASQAQWDAAALVRHAPEINGRLHGSVRQVLAENISVTGSAVITRDLLVPGRPLVRLEGSAHYDGTVDLRGASVSGDFQVKLTGGASVRHVVRGATTGEWDAYFSSDHDQPHASPPGSSVVVESATTVLPPGRYASCRVKGKSVLVLGSAGSLLASTYEFDHVSVDARAELKVVGPVVLRVRGDIEVRGLAGDSEQVDWLEIRVLRGGLQLAGGARFYGYVGAAAGTVELKGTSELVGGIVADRLRVDGGASVHIRPRQGHNAVPLVELVSPQTDGEISAGAAIVLEAVAVDLDGSVTRVEFFADDEVLGVAAGAPFQTASSALRPGTHEIRARAYDDAGQFSDSAPAILRVISDVPPPVVTLTKPTPHGIYRAPAMVTIEADVAPESGPVTRVEFSVNGVVFAGATATPYQCAMGPLDVGQYTITAEAFGSAPGISSTAVSPFSVLPANEPPSVVLSSAEAGRQIPAPAAITLQAQVEDSDGQVAAVEFFEGLTPIGTKTSEPYELTVIEDEPRDYFYLARAIDDLGAATDSAPVSLTVTPATPLWTHLPFQCGFEAAEGFTPGVFAASGWQVVGPLSVAFDPEKGKQHVILPGGSDASLVRKIIGIEGGTVFTDAWCRPVATASPETATRVRTSMAEIAVVRVGTSGCLMARTNGTWIAAGGRVALDESGATRDWLRVTVREDYSEGYWDLYLDGSLIAARLAAAESADRLLEVGIVAAGAGDSWVDSIAVTSANPLFGDVDADGMPDAWEFAYDLDPLVNDRYRDPDADGVRNIFELVAGTSPRERDSDGDGLPDGWEIEWGSDPIVPDEDDDPDGDGLSNAAELALGSSPLHADSDGDGLSDAWEKEHGLDVRHDDSGGDFDGDGVSNGDEIRAGTDPADYYNGVAPVVTSLVGDDGALTADGAIAVVIRDPAGRVLVNAPYRFSAEIGGHLLAATPMGPAMKAVEVRTDENGVARAWVRGGTR
jgi:hypothetical protein